MTETGGQVAGGGRSMLDNMVGVSDMVLLEPLSEDGLIENLWDRYNNKDIYVSNDIQCSITISSFVRTTYQSMPLLLLKHPYKILLPQENKPLKTKMQNSFLTSNN